MFRLLLTNSDATVH